jgi:hypothetical protein
LAAEWPVGQEEAEQAAVMAARGTLALRAFDDAILEARMRSGKLREAPRKRARTDHERQLAAAELAAVQSRVAAATGLQVYFTCGTRPAASGCALLPTCEKNTAC